MKNTFYKYLCLAFAYCLIASIPTTSYAQNCMDSTYYGLATYYAVSGPSSCSSPMSADSVSVAAINLAQFDTTVACGACALITSARGSATVAIVDFCPSCAANSLDLSIDLVTVLDTVVGTTPIHWQYVACPVTGSVQLFLHNASQYYAEVRVNNHRYAVKSMDYLSGSLYLPMRKSADNYFVATSGMGVGPYSFRITDVLGDTIYETNIPLPLSDSTILGSHQFPLCTPVNGIADITNQSGVQVRNNPAKNECTLINNMDQGTEYIVYDALGRRMQQGTVAAHSYQAISLSTAGLYFIQCPNVRSGQSSFKVVVN